MCIRDRSKPEFKTYAEQILKNAKALAQGLMDEGMDIVGGMTENHLMTLDLRKTCLLYTSPLLSLYIYQLFYLVLYNLIIKE